jgi:ABC-type Fe3+ transport system substrate-binding protein
VKKFLSCLSILVILVASAASGQSGESADKPEWDKIVAAAKKEGKLVIYAELDPDTRQALTSVFGRKFGIQLEFVAGKSAEISKRYLSERGAGLHLVDVFHMGAGTAVNIMKPQKSFVSLESFLLLPEVKEKSAYLFGDIPYLDKEKMAIALIAPYTSYVSINTAMVKEGEIKSYRDVLSPKWKGKVVLYDPAIPSAAAGWAAFMIGKAYGLEEGTKFLKEFASTQPVMIKDVRQQVEWVARGKYAIGVGTQHAEISNFKMLGLPIFMQRFVEGGNINPASAFIERPVNPPHPNAATVYLNWLLTEEGQRTVAEGMSSPPIRKGVVVKGIDPMKIVKPGEKAFFTDEEFYQLQGKAIALAKKIFADLRQ